jgi:serine/threonine protein kinase
VKRSRVRACVVRHALSASSVVVEAWRSDRQRDAELAGARGSQTRSGVTEDDNDLVGQVVEERYRIEAQLGSGGMGAVYRARHVKVGREVAIKVLHDHLLADPTMVERFEREAAVAARLSHRNVIAVIDVGETAAKQKLMVLELARGTCLAEIVEGGALPGPRVVNLVAQLLAGLEHAHGHGLVHRDLKPENVIVEIDEHGIEVPKIVDFGIAMLRGDTSGGNHEKRLTTAGTVLGTPQYMAPEHAQGRDVDPRCDLFSLGVMTYEMLAGRSPFDGTGVELAIANITQDPPAICERSGVTVDPLLEAFARRLMARRVRDRFPSARAALDVLELIEAHPEAAREILFPAAPRGKTPAPRERSTVLGTMAPFKLTPAPRPPSELAPRPTPKGSERRTIISAAALATTIEAPAPCKPTKRPRPTKRPWKSAVLVAASAIAVAGVVAGVIAARLSARTPDLAAPALDGDGVPAILIRVRDVAMESPISLA